MRTADYTVATVAENVVNGGGNSYTDISNPVELGAFSLLNNGASDGTTRDVNFQSITLRLSGAGHLQNLSNITLERNGVVVASNPTINNTDLTFSVGDKILNGQTATYYIKATVNTVENATDDYTFTIRNTTDINIGEVSTMFRTTKPLTSL